MFPMPCRSSWIRSLTISLLIVWSGCAGVSAQRAPAGHGLDMKRLTPVGSEPGVLICEPLCSGDPVTVNFGAACTRWLQFVVGGQGELGRTPLWEGFGSA